MTGGVSVKRAFKMQFRNAYFRSLVQKLWSKLVKATLHDVFCLKLRKGAIFEQNILSKICTSVKMSQRFAWHFWRFQETFEVNRSKSDLIKHEIKYKHNYHDFCTP